MARSGAIHDFVAGVLRGDASVARVDHPALAAPLHHWRRVLGFEGCAVRFDRALRRARLAQLLPEPVRALLRDAAATAVRHGLLAHRQLDEIDRLAAAHCVRVLALKGAARLLAGEPPGTRSLSDIDLLVAPEDAGRVHALLCDALGYESTGPAQPHHLPVLRRPGALDIDLHFRLSRETTALDRTIWQDARWRGTGEAGLGIPSATAMVLHALEHGTTLNWMGRYRLRDILDVASLFGADVSTDAVRAHVAASGARRALETLLSAAHTLEPRVPRYRARAWDTVRRVSRARLALAMLPRDARVAERCFRYAGVLAEGSPRSMLRAGMANARRLVGALLPRMAAMLAVGAGMACHDPSAPARERVAPFVFVSDVDATPGIYRWEDSVVTRLSADGVEDDQPHSAAGRIVFVSRRDGNPEIYVADLALGAPQRLTTTGWTDVEPALSPDGATVAFVSNRSGAPRVWLMDAASGANVRALGTGSASFGPEGAPAWSPAGDRIAFTSTRTGTSQVFVVAAAGGEPVQASHESTGAFAPAWSTDGSRLLYTSAGQSRIMSTTLSSDRTTVFATDARGLRDVACDRAACIAVAGAADAAGDIVAMQGNRSPVRTLLERTADDRAPVFLVPATTTP